MYHCVKYKSCPYRKNGRRRSRSVQIHDPGAPQKRLEDAAHSSRRSLSAEIVARLETSFMLEDEPTHDLVTELVSNVFENLVNIGALDPQKLEEHYEKRGKLPKGPIDEDEIADRLRAKV